MRIALILIFGVFTASISLCRANLGDTLDQCIARYGKRMPSSGLADPSRVGGEEVTFQHDGCNIEAYLFNGVVECETIMKTDNSLFSVPERDKIVKSESANGAWAAPVTVKGLLIWMRSDGAFISCYPLSTPLIFVMSRKYIQLAAAFKKEHPEFPSEAEARKYIVLGMNEEDVIKKFGVPMIRSPSGSDGEVLDYSQPPAHKEMTFGYGGFEVFVKNGKVTDLEIIHQTVRLSK